MHAVLVKVQLDPVRYEETTSYLHERLVPRIKGAPGLVRGTWIGDEKAGYSLMVFQSEEQARQMAAMVTSGPDEPVQVQDVQVYEVQAET